jgi:hypothetical protein
MKVAKEVLSLATQHYISPQFCYVETILGMFTKLQKMTISFVMTACLPFCLSVHPSARNDSAPTGQMFIKFISVFLKHLLRKSFTKI